MSCKQHLYALHFVVTLILDIHSFVGVLLMIYVCELPICLQFSTVHKVTDFYNSFAYLLL